MKIPKKLSACLYGLAVIANIFNAWLSFRGGNIDAMIAWSCAAGMSAGACAAYLDLIEKENKDEDSVS